MLKMIFKKILHISIGSTSNLTFKLVDICSNWV